MGRITQQFAWVVGISTVGFGYFHERRRKRRAQLPPIDAPRESRTLEVDQRCFGYYVDRAAGKDPLFLVPGLEPGASVGDVRPIFEQYRHERTVLALDFPKATPASYEEALRLVLNREAKDGADLVALHDACPVATQLACERPHLVRSLALLAPPKSDRYERVPVPTIILHDEGPPVAQNGMVRVERIAGAGADPQLRMPQQTFLLLERAWKQRGSQPAWC